MRASPERVQDGLIRSFSYTIVALEAENWIETDMNMKLLPLLLLILLAPQWSAAQALTYEEGKQAYLDKDYDRALEVIRPLAEQGDSQAQVTLGVMYDFGHGVEKDSAEALKWYIKAAEQGIPIVQHDVGVKYFQGQGVKQDFLKAAYWWEKSAAAGIADSQFNLGLLYYRGIGLEIDYPRALELFTAAAEQDHPNAQYSLAVLYAFGQGVKQDYTQALKWFSKAADNGVPQAQFNLGVFYEKGYGLPDKDLAEAEKWYKLAAEQGVDEAAEQLAGFTSVGSQTEPAVAAVEHPEISELGAAKTTEETMAPESAFMTQDGEGVSDGQIRGEDWVYKQPRDTYTIQLSSLLKEQDIINFIRRYNLTERAAYVRVNIKGTQRYNALYGSYSTYAAAKQALSTLPESLRSAKPWIRNFGLLQDLMKR